MKLGQFCGWTIENLQTELDKCGSMMHELAEAAQSALSEGALGIPQFHEYMEAQREWLSRKAAIERELRLRG